MRLPTGIEVFNHTPIYPGSHFTWGEATKGCTRCPEDLVIDGQLIATSAEVVQSIISLACYLDHVRELLGNHPLYVNSWYRPSAVNRQHQNGGLGRYSTFVHVDLRGHKARWG